MVAFLISDEPAVTISLTIVTNTRGFRVLPKFTHTSYGQTRQFQHAQLIAVSYHHADSSITYIAALTDSKLFQMYASVNTNTMKILPQGPHTDICSSCSRQTTIFRHVNMLIIAPFCNYIQSFITQIFAS
jgi:hypothetical protein